MLVSTYDNVPIRHGLQEIEGPKGDDCKDLDLAEPERGPPEDMVCRSRPQLADMPCVVQCDAHLSLSLAEL